MPLASILGQDRNARKIICANAEESREWESVESQCLYHLPPPFREATRRDMAIEDRDEIRRGDSVVYIPL